MIEPSIRAGLERRSDPESLPVVHSHNEWDPLEEVVVGRAGGAAVPPWHPAIRATMPESWWQFFQRQGGQAFPAELIAAAERELDAFCRLLEAEGATVRRPDRVDHRRRFATPDWESSGLYAAMPRDCLLVIGDEIIEVPMAWRCRYFEVHAYRRLLKEYFRAGARWTAAPRPELGDDLYDHGFVDPEPGQGMRYVIGEGEPTFDAADFIRLGRDLIAQQSNVTNRFGIEWLARHLGDRYTIHVLEPDDTHPMHIDATLIPLAPGRMLVNPERCPRLPPAFRHWERLEAPPPANPDRPPPRMCSHWISMNVLSLDTERVCVQHDEEPLIRKLEEWGFTPVRCDLAAFNHLGGGFHCATLDVRRRGTLESYV